ncbi:transcriptional protein SWT1 isoform X2 [Hoplias malabaricus]
MTKKKAKKHKKERRTSSTPPLKDRGKRKDDKETLGHQRGGEKHKHVSSRRKVTDYPPPSSEDSPKKERHKKSEGQSKSSVLKGSKVSQDSDHRALHGSEKHSSLGHVSSSGKSSSSHASSRHANDVLVKDLEEQRKKLVKRRSSAEGSGQKLPKPAFLSDEKRKKTEKRRIWPEEDYPATKRRNTEERDDVGVDHRKPEELSQERKKLVEKRSKELPKDLTDGKYRCHTKKDSHSSKESSPSVKNTKATSPRTQGNDGIRQQSYSRQAPSSCHPPVAFKIPKKSTVVKAPSNTLFWDNGDKTPADAKQHATSVSVGSLPVNAAPEQKKWRPLKVSTQDPVCSKLCKTFSSPQVQQLQSSPLRERGSPSSTAAGNTVSQVATVTKTAEPAETFDNDQEMQLVEELHLARSDRTLQVNLVESYGELTCMDVDPPEESTSLALSQEKHQEDLLIVLDTNVLLSHLDFVKKMISHGLGALGFPTLLVPWVVLQELDSLKSGKLSQNVEHKARPAVHYIYSCLKNQVPRLWGQSMQQASQASCGLDVVNNDDRVLHCCLQFQTLFPEGTLILCSDDKNLCSKALLSGVKALSKADLMEQAEGNLTLLNRSYNPRTAHPPAGHTKKEQEMKQCDEEEAASRREAACVKRELSECVSVLESNLKSALSAVLEEEMKAAYGELWTEIVYLKPPWTLETVLQCFKKHWIAVFGNIIKRNLLSCVETLSTCLCSDASVGYDSILTALHAAKKLLMELSSRSEYSGQLTPALSCLQTVRNRLQDQPQKCKVEDTSDGDTLMAEAAEDTTPPSQTSRLEVWAFFESLWNKVCHIRSALFSALNYSPDSMESGQLFSTPPPQDALTCLHRLSAVLTQLLGAFQRVLCEDSTVEDAQNLLTVIHTSEIAAVESRFNAKDLFECLSQPEYREKLRVGGAQLMQLRTNLDHCAATVCGQSGRIT